jgi:4-aminobutyrate aminotransferase
MRDVPGPKAIGVVARDMEVMSPSLTRPYPLVVERGEGVHLYDVDGYEYLDFAACIGVMNAGYGNPEVTEAIKEQLSKLTHCAFSDFYAELPVEFAEKLTRLSGYQRVFFSNSGTEAVEAALKLAMWYTKKTKFIAFYQCFHGRTLGSLSLTSSRSQHREHFPGFQVFHSHYAYCYRCPLNLQYPDCSVACAGEIETLLFRRVVKPEDVAAIVVEPVQGEGGYIVPPPEFHRELRCICDDYSILLIADEVQTCSYRTGSFLAMEHFNVRADITTLAKPIGGGLPLGATLSSSEIMSWQRGTHANTFGGNLLSVAAGLASINYLEKHGLGRHAEETGEHIKEILKEMQEKYPLIGDVRGVGLMIGVEIINPDGTPAPQLRDAIIEQAFEDGLILLPAGDSTIRISPPLVITAEEAEEGLGILEGAIKKLKG